MPKYNPYKILIMHYKDFKWRDCTDKVFYYKQEQNCVRVRFYGSKFYNISYSKIDIYENPREINIYDKIMYVKGYPLDSINKILQFGQYVKVFFDNGISKTYDINGISFNDNVLLKPSILNKLLYYKKVASYLNITTEEGFLENEFDKITSISSDSVLNYYFKEEINKYNNDSKYAYIFPFGLNLSQKAAVEKVFSSNISIIEGPPGTGKTQTILNIIANILIRNKTVAIVSGNNSATKNVQEKLQKYGYDFFTAFLGNKDNKELFFKYGQKSKPKFKIEKHGNINNLNYYSNNLTELFGYQNEIAKLKEKIANIKLEHEYYKKANEINKEDKIFYHLPKSDNIIRFKIRCLELLKKDKKIGYFKKLLWKFKYSLRNTNILNNAEKFINCLDNSYYLALINESNKKIKLLRNKLTGENFKQHLNSYIELSKNYFENNLNNKFNNKKLYDYQNYKVYFNKFIEDYPVIFSTTNSIRNSIKENYLFDYLIIDESSQVDLLTGIIAMSVCKNIVVVGDLKQLPQIDKKDLENINIKLMKNYGIKESQNYIGNSILTSIYKLYRENVPKTLLKEHYRCNPKIINFCNQKFYNNELIILTKDKQNQNSLKLTKTVKGNHAYKNPDGNGLYNQREIDIVKIEIERNKIYKDIGVITPYRKQANIISKMFNEIEADTIHKFQGREKDYIIFSSVANEVNDFVEDENLINVAVSRAKNCFHLITSDKIYNSKKGVIADLVKYIKYNNPKENYESDIISIYDILSAGYEKELKNFSEKHKRVSKYDSENITYNFLNDILKELNYTSLKIAMHINLKLILRNYNDFNEKEIKYLKHPLTHVDFVIYNKMDKSLVLVIEVDGVTFHEQKQKQKEHDIIKDRALKENNINFIRLKTNESNERKRVIEKLNLVLDK